MWPVINSCYVNIFLGGGGCMHVICTKSTNNIIIIIYHVSQRKIQSIICYI